MNRYNPQRLFKVPEETKTSLIYDPANDGYKLAVAKKLISLAIASKEDWYKYLAGERLHLFPEYDETKHVIELETNKPEQLINDGIPFALYDLTEEAKIEIKPGVYRFVDTGYGWVLKKIQLNTDNFIEFRKNDKQDLYKEIKDFFADKNKYKTVRHKKAALLFGPPGNGKTRLTSKILENADKDNFICLFITSEIYSLSVVENFRKALQGKNIVFIFEELTERASDRYSAEELLSFLDGEMSWSNSYTIATTNYPEKLPENVIDRPGRFNQIIKFDNPNKEERTSFLTAKGLKDQELQDAVTLSEGLSLDYLVQATIQAELKELPVSQYLKEFKKTRELIKQNFKPMKLGLGLSSLDDE